jgi:hypothetical protein
MSMPTQPTTMLDTNPSTPNSINKKSQFQNTQDVRFARSIRVKRTYSSTHNNMVEATEKGNKMLVESID